MSIVEKSMLTEEENTLLIEKLEQRFHSHLHRHEDLMWKDILTQIINKESLLLTLYKMEETGGEPDVIVFGETSEVAYVDCVKEAPKGRRKVCYDEKARLERKKFPPEMSAKKQAEQIGITLLTEAEYRALQQVESLDEKTSTWLETPEDIRSLGGALFADRRYNHVFVYHNGADSYYGVRGYRGKIVIS